MKKMIRKDQFYHISLMGKFVGTEVTALLTMTLADRSL